MGAKSMRVRLVLGWKRVQVELGMVDMDLLEFEEVLDCRHNRCLLASWGNPRGQEGRGLLLMILRRFLDTFYARRQILVKLRYLYQVTHRPLLSVLLN